ncbi:hypothetical protein AAVH_25070 [Aphelenchoides avenae]|nr:hypothetical protein AAVH_25070 [Aphelenchus avenae]
MPYYVHGLVSRSSGDTFKLKSIGGNSEEQAGWSYVVRCEYIREICTPSKGEGQDEVKRSVMFRLAKDAGQYLLGLIRSSTVVALVLDAITPQEALFKSLVTVAPTVRVRDMTLQNCTVSHIDASLLYDALLQFSTVECLLLGNRLKARQITNPFLAAAHEKHITRFAADSKPVDADVYDVTDVGIRAYLFRTTTKKVEMRISHVAVSPTFCADLFKNALEDPAENELVLTIQCDTSDQDFAGILEYDNPSGETHRFDTRVPSGMELTLHAEKFEMISGEDIQMVFFRRFKAAAPGWMRRGGGKWTSDDDSDTEEDDAAMDPQH